MIHYRTVAINLNNELCPIMITQMCKQVKRKYIEKLTIQNTR